VSPRIAIQLVTWNSAPTLGGCLASLHAQDDDGFDLTVVDNGSADGSADLVARWMARGLRGTLVREERNRGFCGGHNRALRESRADWVLFLNPDAELPPTFVRRAAERLAAVDPEVGSVVPRLLLPDGRIDSTGLVVDRYRRVRDRGHGQPAEGAFLAEEDVTGGSGAVVLHRRAMLDDVALGGAPLDENLFAYYDDLDLAWRARIRGWRCRYVPDLVALHRRGGRNAIRSGPWRPASRAQAFTVRNRLLVMAKCERWRDLVRDLPWLVGFEIVRAAYLAVRAPGALRGYPGVLRGLPAALRDRRTLLAAGRGAA
jgi:GT2 family glycosyltransferase